MGYVSFRFISYLLSAWGSNIKDFCSLIGHCALNTNLSIICKIKIGLNQLQFVKDDQKLFGNYSYFERMVIKYLIIIDGNNRIILLAY